jgi:hypothetical protein
VGFIGSKLLEPSRFLGSITLFLTVRCVHFSLKHRGIVRIQIKIWERAILLEFEEEAKELCASVLIAKYPAVLTASP